jgi:pyruvate,water dikinase
MDVAYTPTAYAEITVPKSIEKLTEKTKKYIKNRERLRLYRTYVYSVVRNIFLAYGRNYAQEDRLERAEDVFYLTKQEVFSGRSNEGAFKKLVQERKKQAAENAKKPIYNRVVFFNDKALEVKTATAEKGLRGIPSGNGVVTARVSLMNAPEDKLEKGNIILTKRTDPGWIGLFPKASGLIVEHGSMLSHSFVVARELNLPAVVGVEMATALIEDNALVTLDGLKGEVVIERDKD